MNISYLKLEEENKLFLLKYLLLQSLKIFKSKRNNFPLNGKCDHHGHCNLLY